MVFLSLNKLCLSNRTNVPYQIMEYPDFHYPNDIISYPSHSDVLKYLNSYAEHFDVKRHIQFSHLVIRVRPVKNTKWEIIVKNLPNNTYETKIYDLVFICNGHYSKPFVSEIPGAHDFGGKIIHSHDFRTAEAYHSKYSIDV